jgi:pantoate--beta-alanine ligase
MEVVETHRALRAALAQAPRPIAFVPTMGALHPGHLSLVELARAKGAATVVVSIFVNPTQFGPGEDFERYPRTLDADCAALAGAGCDIVFVPSVEEVYPPDFASFIEPAGPARGFEADARPGHFRGVATVVARLLGLVRPDLAVFGQKDAQQLAVIRRLVNDLALPVEIVAAPIARERDGLAMSSRNRYLDPEQRRGAVALARALDLAGLAVIEGELVARRIIELVQEHLFEEPPVDFIDYVAVVDADTFEPLDHVTDNALLVVAVRFGATRLLDNRRLAEEYPY